MTTTDLNDAMVLGVVQRLQRSMNGAAVYLPQIQATLKLPDSAKTTLWRLLDELVEAKRLVHDDNTRSGYSLPEV